MQLSLDAQLFKIPCTHKKTMKSPKTQGQSRYLAVRTVVWSPTPSAGVQVVVKLRACGTCGDEDEADLQDGVQISAACAARRPRFVQKNGHVRYSPCEYARPSPHL